MGSSIKTLFFMTLMTAIFVAVGGMIDRMYGGNGRLLWIFTGFAVLMNFGTYWFADTIVLKMHGAKVTTPEEAPQLHAMVERLCQRARLPKPKVCVVPTHIPNAFATGRNRSHAAVAVTEGLMQMLSEEEVEGVIAHELAHIRHYDMLLNTVIASMAGVISMLTQNAMFGLMLGGGGGRDRENNNPLAIVGLLLTIVLAPILATLVRSLISHQREFAADAGGAEISGNPVALASALRRIESHAGQIARVAQHEPMGTPATEHLYFINHFSLGGRAMRLFSSHPPTDERVERLEAMARQGQTGRTGRYNRG